MAKKKIKRNRMIKRSRFKSLEEVLRTKDGPKTKCTDKMIDDFCGLLYKGLPVDKCCDILRITEQTYYNWLKWGEAYMQDRELKKHKVYMEFILSIKEVLARWQLKILDRSLDLNRYHPGWVKDMTMLERRDRENWGRNAVGISTDQGYSPDEKFL